MKNAELLDRIETDPHVMAGKPVIRGTRLTVEYVLKRLATGSEIDDLLGEYQRLTAEDVSACLLFASESLAQVEFLPLAAKP